MEFAEATIKSGGASASWSILPQLQSVVLKGVGVVLPDGYIAEEASDPNSAPWFIFECITAFSGSVYIIFNGIEWQRVHGQYFSRLNCVRYRITTEYRLKLSMLDRQLLEAAIKSFADNKERI